jgi:hypothetical protein
MKKTIAAFLGVLGLAVAAYSIGLSGLIINQPGIAVNTRYSFDLNAADVNTVAATAVYSSAAFSSSNFSTGQGSTGSFLVASNTLLTAAAATNNITVSAAGSTGDSVVIQKRDKPGAYVLLAGRDWSYGATTALTAASIAHAMQTIPWLSSSASGSVVYATAPAGAFYNGIHFGTNASSLSLAHATLVGGVDAPTVCVIGYCFQAGRDYTVGASSALSATALKNAINAKAGLSSYVSAATQTSSVTVQSVFAGAYDNFPLSTSNSSAISVIHPTMVGGANPAWVLGGKSISLPAHGFTLGLPVLYSVGSGAAVISGLTGETTYYAIPVDANTVQLASSANNAVAGTAIVLASSSTVTAAKSYTLAPLPWVAGSAGFDWETSPDNTTWTPIATSSVTFSNGGAGSMAWTFNGLAPRYLSLNVTGPTAGGLKLAVTANGTYVY